MNKICFRISIMDSACQTCYETKKTFEVLDSNTKAYNHKLLTNHSHDLPQKVNGLLMNEQVNNLEL